MLLALLQSLRFLELIHRKKLSRIGCHVSIRQTNFLVRKFGRLNINMNYTFQHSYQHRYVFKMYILKYWAQSRAPHGCEIFLAPYILFALGGIDSAASPDYLRRFRPLKRVVGFCTHLVIGGCVLTVLFTSGGVIHVSTELAVIHDILVLCLLTSCSTVC